MELDISNIKFELIPNKKVGPFIIGENINKYSSYPLVEIHDEYDSATDWHVYGIPNSDFRIYTEENKIETISCKEECIYKRVNLIGLKYEEFLRIVGTKHTSFDKQDVLDETFDVYEFDSKGLQVWVINGIVKTIMCTNYNN